MGVPGLSDSGPPGLATVAGSLLHPFRRRWDLVVAGGLAGTLLYMVSLQRRSLDIRLALGAPPRGLERGVLASGVRLAGIGVVIGTIGAAFAGRLIESRLYGLEARDARTLVLAVSVLMLTALLSSWIPARRAAVINPIESLRAE